MHQRKRHEKIQAYIMTNMYPGDYSRSLDEIKKIDCIEKISIVTGDYDIVIKAKVNNLGQLHKVTSQLRKVNGVEKTFTQIIEKDCNSLLKS